MFGKIGLIVVLCVACVVAEAPVYRYRGQRLRQLPQRQRSPFFARQEAEPAAPNPKPEYGAPPQQAPNPKPEYGAPPATEPAPAYGPPPPKPDESGDESSTDTEVVNSQPSRFMKFDRLRVPSKNAQKFQRLELQQQIQTVPNRPLQPLALQPIQYAAIQQEGSYFIQLPNGAIQRVNYLTQPSLVDDSVTARLQFRPIAEAQITAVDPQLYINTQVQSYTSE